MVKSNFGPAVNNGVLFAVYFGLITSIAVSVATVIGYLNPLYQVINSTVLAIGFLAGAVGIVFVGFIYGVLLYKFSEFIAMRLKQDLAVVQGVVNASGYIITFNIIAVVGSFLLGYSAIKLAKYM